MNRLKKIIDKLGTIAQKKTLNTQAKECCNRTRQSKSLPIAQKNSSNKVETQDSARNNHGFPKYMGEK